MRRLLVFFVVLTFSLALPTLAGEIHVPAQQPTIQAGIDAAVTDDEVVVADGVYTGTGNRDIDFHGKAITVRSANGPENCIIDCQGSAEENHRGFYLHSGETVLSIIDGFTIMNGYALYGGGICCENESSPTIQDNIIMNNTSMGDGWNYFDGGGICMSGHGLITRNVIKWNTAALWGGGIFWRGVDDGDQITHNTILENSASYGGGICVMARGMHLLNNLIVGNVAYGGYYGDGGGGFQHLIRSNFYRGHGSTTIRNCTFVENSSAILSLVGSWLDISKSIFWDNGPGVEIFMQAATHSPTLNIDCSVVQGGQAGVYLEDSLGGPPAELNWGTNMLDADPLFCEPSAGDYYLASNSPCAADQQPTCLWIGARTTGCGDVPFLALDLSCAPGSGTLPFDTTISVAITNHYQEQSRRYHVALDVDPSGGSPYQWKSGIVTVAAGQAFTTSWTQTVPALPGLFGDNVLSLHAEDVTPPPYNQPPYPPEGETDTDACTVSGIAP